LAVGSSPASRAKNDFMSKIKTYFEESYNELMHKVTWPTWSDLQSSAILVMISSVIIALVIFAMDFTFSNSMELFYELFK
jgi:preprotein translocase subunit SecE